MDPIHHIYTGANILPNRNRLPASIKFLNRVLGKFRVPFLLQPRLDPSHHMLTAEQAANMHLLIDRVLETEVPGALVELGSYTGTSAVLISHLIEQHGDQREFHVYDRFDMQFGQQLNIREVFKKTIEAAGVPMPIIHDGDFHGTVPAELPEVIAFAHIDCGSGGPREEHALLVTHCLKGVYPRLAPGGVIIFMDYHRAGETLDGLDSNPGVQMACDTFFSDKPEKMQLLYGGLNSHGFVRKQ